MHVNIRRMIRRDLAQILELENDLFEFPWTEREFIEALTPHDGEVDAYCLVAEQHEQVIGYMVFDLDVHVWLIAVSKENQRKGVGRQFIDHLKEKYPDSQISLELRETNLPAQYFFSQLGFKAKLLQGFYPDLSEDAYSMTYQPESLMPENKLSQHSME